MQFVKLYPISHWSVYHLSYYYGELQKIRIRANITLIINKFEFSVILLT